MQTALRVRTEHTAAFEALTNTHDPKFDRWADTRLERWLVDWMLRNGRFETARALSEAKGLEVRSTHSNNYNRSQAVPQNLVDIELFAEIRRIKVALEHQSCTEALSWCSENKVALRKIKVRD
jgi:macrophage erythroblast attacher